MRIATQTIYNTLVGQIQNLDSSQSSIETQLSSGLAFTDASQNPSGMNSAMNLISENGQLSQYQANASTALSSAQTSYSAITSLNSLANQASSIATEANSGTNSTSDLQSYGDTVNQLIEQAVQVGNTESGGNYIFAGTAVSTPPYTVTRDSSGNITGVTYSGNDGQAAVPISANSSVAVATSGATNQQFADFMNQMISLRDALNAGDTSTIASTETSLSASSDNIVAAAAQNGAIQSRIEAEQSQQTSMSTSLGTIISDQTSVDVATAEIKLTQAESSYQAVLSAAGKIMSTSLLDYLTTTT